MFSNFTKHAEIRAQQRGIPYEIADLLIQYGDAQHDGNGGVVRYFSARSVLDMQDDIGKNTVKKMAEHLRAYLVESSKDGAVITVGKLHPKRHIWKH